MSWSIIDPSLACGVSGFAWPPYDVSLHDRYRFVSVPTSGAGKLVVVYRSEDAFRGRVTASGDQRGSVSLPTASFVLATVVGGLGLLIGARWLLITGAVTLLFSQLSGALERFDGRRR